MTSNIMKLRPLELSFMGPQASAIDTDWVETWVILRTIIIVAVLDN